MAVHYKIYKQFLSENGLKSNPIAHFFLCIMMEVLVDG